MPKKVFISKGKKSKKGTTKPKVPTKSAKKAAKRRQIKRRAKLDQVARSRKFKK